jgi:lipopolysaccharide/colanic/teichoic acid biosynthesis glycosyltransferase
MNAHITEFDKEITSIDLNARTASVRVASHGVYRSAAKRLLDIVLVIVALPIALPMLPVLAIIVAIDGHSPIYRQKRVGMGGRLFTMWKLRTMVPNAKEMLESYLSMDNSARSEWSDTQKLKYDPRITSLGRFLRKSSLDELPQLWNVLKGDMSIVGPRPMMPEQQILYPGSCYYALRPGITGLWQVSTRNLSSFADRASFDTIYNRSLSFKTDVMVIWATVGVVLRGTGY